MIFFELAGSFFFWALALPILLAIGLWRIEEHGESGLVAFLALVIMAGLQFFTDIKPFTFIWQHPAESLFLVLGYVAVGVAYVWLKWYSFVHAAARRLKDWQSRNTNQQAYGHHIGVKSLPIRVGDYKWEIFGWMFYWPLSGAWTLLNDPVRRLFNAIYERIGGTLQKIADKAFNVS